MAFRLVPVSDGIELVVLMECLPRLSVPDSVSDGVDGHFPSRALALPPMAEEGASRMAALSDTFGGRDEAEVRTR